jgi:hypothetical protein
MKEYRVARFAERSSRNVARASVKQSIHMEAKCDRRPRRYGNLLYALPLLLTFFCPVATDITGKSQEREFFLLAIHIKETVTRAGQQKEHKRDYF